MTNDQIEKRLDELPKEIYRAGTIAIGKRTRWHNIKAKLELEKSKVKLLAKVKNPDETQTDLHAKATEKTYELSLKVITSESKYRVAAEQREQKDNEFCALRKIGSLRNIPGVQ